MSAGAGRPLIEVRGASKTFGTRSGESIQALAEVSLGIAPGEFVCIVGASGCGKSTLLRLVAGLVAPTMGGVTIGGSAVTGPRRDIGMVFQDPVLLPWRTVLKNVLVPAEVIGMERREAARRAAALLDLVGLGGFTDKYPGELSGGMRQRAAIARALMHDPEILLMDEPFGALDAMTREAMNQELLRIWQGNRKTVILVTHSIDEAVFLADRVVVMSPRPGSVRQTLAVDVERPRTSHTRLDPTFLACVGAVRAHFESVLVGG
ncbi:MAG: ABC transporter ATP-binding protein [Candidatus Rokuibacteriota bacterium]